MSIFSRLFGHNHQEDLEKEAYDLLKSVHPDARMDTQEDHALVRQYQPLIQVAMSADRYRVYPIDGSNNTYRFMTEDENKVLRLANGQCYEEKQ